MIVDCVMASYEADALAVRDAELNGVVHLRVVVHGNETFRGAPLDPPMITLSKTRTIIASLILQGDPWEREFALRQFSLDVGLEEGGTDAMLILADADEIPHPDAVRTAALSGQPSLLPNDMREWFMNWRAPDVWQPPHQPLIGRYRDYENAGGAQVARAAFSWPMVGPRGWHLSTLGDGALAAAKIASFAHSEYDTPEHVNAAILDERRDGAMDILNRFALEPATDLPSCWQDFPHLMSPDAR